MTRIVGETSFGGALTSARVTRTPKDPESFLDRGGSANCNPIGVRRVSSSVLIACAWPTTGTWVMDRIGHTTRPMLNASRRRGAARARHR